MSLYTTQRERKLWMWSALVLAAVYCSAILGGTLSARMEKSMFLAPAFGTGFVLVLVAIVGNAISSGESRRALWIGLGVAAVLGMILVRLGIGASARTHLFEYGLVAVLLFEAGRERVRGGGAFPAPGVTAVAATAALGWIDEGIQSVVPGRVYDLRDVGINALAGVLAVTGTSLTARVRLWARLRAARR